MTIHHVDEVRSHWWPREGWWLGRLVHTWHLTFEHAPQLHRLAERYQSALATIDGHKAIPTRWLHLTLQSVGYADEVSDDRLAQVTKAVSARVGELPPFELTFHRPTVVGEAVVLTPTPEGPVHRLWQEIRAGITEATGNTPRTKAFHPHVSLTYFNTPGPAQPYVEALNTAEAEPVGVNVDQVALIVQRRVLEPEWVYRWDLNTTAPLATR
ncbi:2'-5' RNA ligase family protein [Nonomuraea jiangxiensis]|uniref:2'-5' RNA ligase n=1 Tax=Nonomuraea jiangxiensis TaxID=633440 RepID=A0A1G8P2Z8_9ACTN|nr:2'-5' RNA ligase family protein [Nonomuraea jiangxiensis]SDI86853.1 2'-5' RNA ligase [Nonomuraea jiangxiensis]